jgi:hypothetical protein
MLNIRKLNYTAAINEIETNRYDDKKVKLNLQLLWYESKRALTGMLI